MGIVKKKIAFLAAEPTETAQLRLGEEIREIQESLKLARYRDDFELVLIPAVRTRDLVDTLRNEKPHIVHFSGHGTQAGELLIEDRVGGGTRWLLLLLPTCSDSALTTSNAYCSTSATRRFRLRRSLSTFRM